MIFNLQANIPQLIGSYNGVVSIYVKQYGSGNLRLSSDRESLVTGAGVSLAPGQIVDGIAQATAQGWVQYFWSGDLWVISDQNGPAVVIAPAYQAYVSRIVAKSLPSDFNLPAEEDGNLSTYKHLAGKGV